MLLWPDGAIESPFDSVCGSEICVEDHREELEGIARFTGMEIRGGYSSIPTSGVTFKLEVV